MYLPIRTDAAPNGIKSIRMGKSYFSLFKTKEISHAEFGNDNRWHVYFMDEKKYARLHDERISTNMLLLSLVHSDMKKLQRLEYNAEDIGIIAGEGGDGLGLKAPREARDEHIEFLRWFKGNYSKIAPKIKEIALKRYEFFSNISLATTAVALMIILGNEALALFDANISSAKQFLIITAVTAVTVITHLIGSKAKQVSNQMAALLPTPKNQTGPA